MLEEVATSIHSYFTSTKPLMWLKDHSSLVEYGIAHFIDEKDRVKIEEPSIDTYCPFTLFEATNYSLLGNLRRHLHYEKGIAFESVILWTMSKWLAKPSKLTDILDFPGNSQPSWIHHCRACIVVQFLDAHVPFSLDEPHEPGSLVACQGTDPATVASWLEGKITAGWCIPSTMMGPELLAILLDNGETVLMVLQCKCCSDKTAQMSWLQR